MTKRFRDSYVLVAGDGVSGRGAKAALEARGSKCFLYDDKTYNAFPARPIDFIVVSPGLAKDHKVFAFAEEIGIPIIGEIELGFILNEGKPIVAVTGTNGKTTTTELIGAMLNKKGKAAVCGNIGKSFAEVAVSHDYDYAAVEVSSFQLETIDKFEPNIACITNISSDHLDRHKTMEAYIAAKLRIAENQTKDDFLILSQDDIPLFALKNFSPRAEVLYTSARGSVRGCYLYDDKIWFLDEYICRRDRVRIAGPHNLANALTAVCAAKLMGVENADIVDVLTSFETDAHRMKEVGRFRGKTYYDDSKGTNIGATLKAAAAMPSPTCLILGGSDKGYEFDELFENLPKQIASVVAVGATADKILRAAYRCGFYEAERAESLYDAVVRAASSEAENVLLSPATASFDTFRNYAERGDEFIRIVKEINGCK